MVEMLLGHEGFGRDWYPAWSDANMKDKEAFSCAVAEALVRVKVGGAAPFSEPVRRLLDGLLLVWNPNRFKIPSTWVFRNEFLGALSPQSSRTHERSKNRGKRVRFDGGREF